MNQIDQLDKRILISIQSWRRPKVTAILKLFTYSATARAWFSIAIVLNVLQISGVQFAKDQTVILRSLFAPLIAWGVGWLLKRLIGRARPSTAIDGYVQLIPSPTCGSFPSSHAASTASFFTALYMFGHPWAPYIGVWAAVVSFSRLYLGVHYLSDILGGALLGALIGFLLAGAI